MRLVIDKFWGGNTFSNQQYTMHDCFSGNKSDLVQTSDAFWQSACVLVSELSFKWYSFMFLVLICSILVPFEMFHCLLRRLRILPQPYREETRNFAEILLRLGERRAQGVKVVWKKIYLTCQWQLLRQQLWCRWW